MIHVIMMTVPGKIPATIAGDAHFLQVFSELCTKDSVVAIILFGSVARGRARPVSDIDLCLLTKTGTPESEQIDLISYGTAKIDISLFSGLPLPIRFRVIKEGIVLFCRDPLALHRTRTATVREYLDTAPLIRKYCLHALQVTG